MSQFFSFKRFKFLVLMHWADNKKRYVLTLLACTGLLITWFAYAILTEVDHPMSEDEQQVVFFFSLFATGTFYASQYFRDLGARAKGSTFLLVPASVFEKMLCSLLYTVPVFFAVFISVFYFVDILMVTLSNIFSGTAGSTGKATVINIFKFSLLRFNANSTINFLLLFFSAQSAFLLGSVYFEKYSFLKTIISGLVTGFIFFCLMYFFYNQLLPGGDYPRGFFTSYRVYIDGINDHLVQVPDWIGQVFRFVVMYSIAPFIWIVAYYRLREKQL